jgi:hypothetical protein
MVVHPIDGSIDYRTLIDYVEIQCKRVFGEVITMSENAACISES